MTSSLDSSFILNEGEPFLQEEYLNPLTDDFNKIYYGGFNNVKANNDIKEEEDEEKSFSGIYFIKPKLNSIQDSNIIIDTSEKKIEGKKIEEKKIEEKKEKNEKKKE